MSVFSLLALHANLSEEDMYARNQLSFALTEIAKADCESEGLAEHVRTVYSILEEEAFTKEYFDYIMAEFLKIPEKRASIAEGLSRFGKRYPLWGPEEVRKVYTSAYHLLPSETHPWANHAQHRARNRYAELVRLFKIMPDAEGPAIISQALEKLAEVEAVIAEMDAYHEKLSAHGAILRGKFAEPFNDIVRLKAQIDRHRTLLEEFYRGEVEYQSVKAVIAPPPPEFIFPEFTSRPKAPARKKVSAKKQPAKKRSRKR